MTTTGFSGLSRIMKSVIIASLALNLLVVGALATAWVRHGGKHFHHGGVERSLMHFARRHLPAEKRSEFKKSWRSERKEYIPLFKDVRESRKAVGRAIQAKPYDRAGVEAALEQVRQKRALVRDRVSQKFLDLVDTLSEEEKHAFGQFIQEDRRHGKWSRRLKKWGRDE